MPKLKSKQLTDLGNSFLAFAQAVGNYRMENFGSLTKAQNKQIKDFHWALLNYADNMFTTSARLTIEDAEESLNTISEVTSQINQTYHNLRKVQKAIAVAAAGVTLGAAIFSQNPQALADGINGLVKSWNAEEE